jgi:hypothetical protein
MTASKYYASNENISNLIGTLDRSAEAGIDPDFDTEMEELERQSAELRLTFGHN